MNASRNKYEYTMLVYTKGSANYKLQTYTMLWELQHAVKTLSKNTAIGLVPTVLHNGVDVTKEIKGLS